MSAFACSCEHFQRLEDFPVYTSVIKCFGKPIIPPLLTPQERLKMSNLRLSILQNQKSSNTTQKSITERNTNLGFFHERNNIIKSGCFSKQNNSAFNVSNPQKIKEAIPSNDLLMSVSKIESSGLFSTVHNEVIVCPNEAKSHNDVNYNTEIESSCSTSEYADSFEENGCDCRECQIKTTDSDVPCRNTNEEQIPSVSEDDQESITEDADFASLPTVICNQKASIQDTDSESIVTCMTQSTDLEKYMDYSIEYSSPDDGTYLSQSSNQRSISSRSDDASTETIINTESEQTPCISAVSELPDCKETSDERNGISHKMLTADAMFDEATNSRAYSVDSYMKILKNCARNLNLKKSLSEPSQQNADHFQTLLPSFSSSEFVEISDNTALKFPSNESNQLELSSRDLSVETSDKISSDAEPELKEVAGRKHIRRNSYTLTHPSEALIMAHAKSRGESTAETSSNRSSSDFSNDSFNSAFKKEAVELVLPSVSDREKMYPVLKCCDNIINADVDASTGLTAHPERIKAVENEKCNHEPENACSYSTSASSVALEDIQICLDKASANLKSKLPLFENHGKSIASQDVENVEKSSNVGQDVVRKNNNEDLLVMLFKELKDSHQMKVNQLMEEQKTQWLKLQEEFKEQERILFEKLNTSGISVPFSQSESHFPSSISDYESSNAYEPNSFNDIPEKLSSSDSNSTNLSSETETFQTVIQKDIDHTKTPSLPQTADDSLLSSSISFVQANVAESNNAMACLYKNKTTVSKDLAVTNNQNSGKSSDNQHVCENECFMCSSNSDITVHSHQLAINDYIPVSVSSVGNDGSYSSGSIKNACFQENYYDENNLHFELQNESLPTKQDRELIHKIPFSECSDVQHSNARICSSKKENSSFSDYSINQRSMQVIDKKSYLALKQVMSANDEDKKSDESQKHKSALIESNYSTKNGDLVNYSSNLSKINFDKPHLSSRLQEKNVIKRGPISQKLSVIPDVSTKAIKLVSASLTNLKRKQTKDLSPEMLKRFEKLPAFVKGYLTRRLFKTEQVQGLIQTMQETVVLMQNLSEELTLKGNSISERDMELYNQLLAQLLSTFEKVYDIFCTYSTKERMKIISESRELRLKKKTLEKKQEASSTSVVSDKMIPQNTHKPTSATIKRRKRSLVDSRTYTISDLKECRARTRSNSSSKSHSVSPTRIYQSSVGVNLSRKTKNCVKQARIHPWK